MDAAKFDVYLKDLASHNWFYQFSDDRSTYSKGKTTAGNLSRTAKQHPAAKEAMELVSAFWSSTDRTDDDKAVLADALKAIRQEHFPD